MLSVKDVEMFTLTSYSCYCLYGINTDHNFDHKYMLSNNDVPQVITISLTYDVVSHLCYYKQFVHTCLKQFFVTVI